MRGVGRRKAALRGSATVEAALLFPLIIILVVSGVSWMFRWYDDWESSLEGHRQKVGDAQPWGSEQLIRWKQWKQVWNGEEDDGSTG